MSAVPTSARSPHAPEHPRIRAQQHRYAFTLLWTASTASDLASGVLRLVLPLLAVRVTRSPLLVSGVTFALTAPWLVVGLQAGATVDRCERRALLLSMSALRLGLLGILLLAATFGLTPLAVLYGAALMLGLTETFTQSGFIALLPMIVPSGRLDRANTFLVGAQQVIEMVAAPLGGLLATAGLLVAVGVGGAGYGAALVALVFLRGTFRPQRPTTRHVLAEVMEGLRFLWSHALLRTIGLMAGVINACWAAWLAVLVLYAVAPGPMKLTAFEYGLLFTAGGIGGLFGVLLLAPLRHALGQRWAIGLNILGNAVMFVAPAITADRWVVGSAIVLGSAVGPMWTITATALQQRIVHERLQGRVSAAYRLLALGAESVGAALGGVVAQVFGVQTVFWVAAVLTLAMLPPFLLIVTEQAMAAGE